MKTSPQAISIQDYINVGLKGYQTFKLRDNRIPPPNVTTVYSEHFLQQLLDEGRINDTDFTVFRGVSADMGYSGTQTPVVIGEKQMGVAVKAKAGEMNDED